MSTLLLTFLVYLSFISLADSQDYPTMKALALALTPAPLGWSGNLYCNWSGVTCDMNDRVTSINLSGRLLSGSFPFSLSSLSYLTQLYLQRNRFSGPLPSLSNLTQLNVVNFQFNGFTSIPVECFYNLYSLRVLELNDNKFSGIIPPSLTLLPFLQQLDVSNNNFSGRTPVFRSDVVVKTSGNRFLGIGDASNSSKARGFWVAIPVLILLVVILVVIAAICQNKKNSRFENGVQRVVPREIDLEPQLPRSSLLTKYTYGELSNATNEFSKKLGRGGFGSVYEGQLNGDRVAVKKLYINEDRSSNLNIMLKQFEAEVKTLARAQHLTLVKLIGYCAEGSNRLLVYEYVTNGSLDRWIYHTDRHPWPGVSFPWGTRRKILLQIAKGLQHLHELEEKILHLDIKPQNILLDQNLNAKICDFGLAKLLNKDQDFTTTDPVGSYGFIAPERLSRETTEKADVYAFGAVTFEVVFGKKLLEPFQDFKNLLHLANPRFEQKKLFNLIETYFAKFRPQHVQDIKIILSLAVMCLHQQPKHRPLMSQVVGVLEGDATISNGRIVVAQPNSIASNGNFMSCNSNFGTNTTTGTFYSCASSGDVRSNAPRNLVSIPESPRRY